MRPRAVGVALSAEIEGVAIAFPVPADPPTETAAFALP